MLPKDTTHLMQRPCYQRGSLRQDPAGKWTTRRPPDDCKETQTAVVWSFSRSAGLAKNILQGTVKGEEDKADRGRGGKTTSENGQAWSSASPRGQWRTGKMEKTGCKIICGAQTTLAVKGLMMMMMTCFFCVRENHYLTNNALQMTS